LEVQQSVRKRIAMNFLLLVRHDVPACGTCPTQLWIYQQTYAGI
jgi:hypothetical protein